MLFLRNEFSKTFEDFSTMTLFTKISLIPELNVGEIFNFMGLLSPIRQPGSQGSNFSIKNIFKKCRLKYM